MKARFKSHHVREPDKTTVANQLFPHMPYRTNHAPGSDLLWEGSLQENLDGVVLRDADQATEGLQISWTLEKYGS